MLGRLFSESAKDLTKKGMIEMNIRQVQHHERTPKKLDSSSFIGDAVAYLTTNRCHRNNMCLLGPMTIRVHESDGSPYEHIVELKVANTKLDIQYNSKFRKIKKKDDGVDPGIAFNQFGMCYYPMPRCKSGIYVIGIKEMRNLLSSEPFEWIRAMWISSGSLESTLSSRILCLIAVGL